MILMRLKKSDGSPFRVFTPFWRTQKNFILKKFQLRRKKLLNVKKINFFNDTISFDEIIAKKNGLKNLKIFGYPVKKNAIKELKIFIKK